MHAFRCDGADLYRARLFEHVTEGRCLAELVCVRTVRQPRIEAALPRDSVVVVKRRTVAEKVR